MQGSQDKRRVVLLDGFNESISKHFEGNVPWAFIYRIKFSRFCRRRKRQHYNNQDGD